MLRSITKIEPICLKYINFQNLIKISIDNDIETLQNHRTVFYLILQQKKPR